jgi:hypothetical protein
MYYLTTEKSLNSLESDAETTLPPDRLYSYAELSKNPQWKVHYLFFEDKVCLGLKIAWIGLMVIYFSLLGFIAYKWITLRNDINNDKISNEAG